VHLNKEVFEKKILRYEELHCILIMTDLRITLSFTRKQKGLAKFPINRKEIIKVLGSRVMEI
jgi:hypothetical protein